MSSRLQTKVYLPVLVAVVTFVAFLPVLQNGFIDLDDDRNITENLAYRGLSGTHLKWMFTTFHGAHYQPLSWLSLGLDYVIWGMNPFGYHLTNLLLHVTMALCVYALALSLRRSNLSEGPTRFSRAAAWSACVAALLFSLHPLRVESVAWVTERRDVLSAPLIVLALLAWLRAVQTDRSRGRWLALSLLLYASSLLAKATGMVLPAILLILDLYPLRRFDLSRDRWIGRANLSILLEKVPYLLLSCGAVILAVMAQARVSSLEGMAGHGFLARVVSAAYGLVFPIWRTLLPRDLVPLYPRPAVIDPLELRFVLSGLAIVAGIGGLLWLRRRHREVAAVLAMAAACHTILLLPVLGIVQIGNQIAADRFAYLPGVVWAIVIGAAWSRLLAQSATEGTYARSSSGHFPRAYGLRVHGIVAVACVALCTLAVLTWRQCAVWRDPLTMWRYASAVAPDEPFYRNYLAHALLRENDVAGAAASFREAVRLAPSDPGYRSNLGMALSLLGDKEGALAAYAEGAAVAEASEKPLARESAELYHNWGLALEEAGRQDDACQKFQRSLAIDPEADLTRALVAHCLTRSGNADGALEALEEGLAYGPPTGQTTDMLALAAPVELLPRLDALLLDGARRYPADPGLPASLALLRIRQGRFADAADSLGTALTVAPGFTIAYVNLARLCLQCGLDATAAEVARAGLRSSRAEPMLLSALREAESSLASRDAVRPSDPAAESGQVPQLRRAAEAFEAGRLDEALGRAEELLRAQPGLPEAQWIAALARGQARHPLSLLPSVAPMPLP